MLQMGVAPEIYFKPWFPRPNSKQCVDGAAPTHVVNPCCSNCMRQLLVNQ